MFARRYFAARYFAPRYFGEGGSGEPPPPATGDSSRRGSVSGVVGGVLFDPEFGSTEARH